MLAGLVGPGRVLFVDQLQRQLVASGMKVSAAQRAGTALHTLMDARVAAAPARTIGVARSELVDALVSGGWGGEQANGMADTVTNPVFLSVYAAAPDCALAAVHAPVLALYTGEDETASTQLSLPAAKKALRENPDAVVEEVPGMDHAFRPLMTGASGKPELSPPAVSAPAVTIRITNWLAAQLHAAMERLHSRVASRAM